MDSRQFARVPGGKKYPITPGRLVFLIGGFAGLVAGARCEVQT